MNEYIKFSIYLHLLLKIAKHQTKYTHMFFFLLQMLQSLSAFQLKSFIPKGKKLDARGLVWSLHDPVSTYISLNIAFFSPYTFGIFREWCACYYSAPWLSYQTFGSTPIGLSAVKENLIRSTLICTAGWMASLYINSLTRVALAPLLEKMLINKLFLCLLVVS